MCGCICCHCIVLSLSVPVNRNTDEEFVRDVLPGKLAVLPNLGSKVHYLIHDFLADLSVLLVPELGPLCCHPAMEFHLPPELIHSIQLGLLSQSLYTPGLTMSGTTIIASMCHSATVLLCMYVSFFICDHTSQYHTSTAGLSQCSPVFVC